MRRSALTAAALAAATLAVLGPRTARAEESRWNIHLQTGPVLTVKQPTVATNDMAFQMPGFNLRAGIEWALTERIGPEVGYGFNVLFHNNNAGTAAEQLLFAGARFRPWYSPTGGYLLPRPTALRDQKPLYFVDILSDAWVDAHVGVALADRTRFLYDVGVGSRVAVIWPLQLGLFARWQHLVGGDGGYMQVVLGITASVGFQPVRSAPDEDGDGVPDVDDRCPHTTRGVRVNEYGCEIRESETKPPPCSDTDLDGVCDGEDDCPDTKLGTAVDKHGCPVGGAPAETPSE